MNPRVLRPAAIVVLCIICGDALALAQRTFVSTLGNDANTVTNCGLTSPCRSFASAMSVTAAYGEIVVIDSGGYGRVTVDKSVAIIAPPGIYAGITVFPGTNGIDIVTADVDVYLRGLTINGLGGVTGIYTSTLNVRLRVENCVITNLTDPSSSGMSVSTTGGEVAIDNTVISGNTFGFVMAAGRLRASRLKVERSAFNGVELADVEAAISESTIADNGGFGLSAGTSGSATIVSVTDTTITGNANSGIIAYSPGTSSTFLAIARATIISNGQSGVYASAGGAGTIQVEVRDSTVKSNGIHGLLIARLSGLGAGVLAATGNLISGNGNRGIFAAGTAITAIASRNTITSNTNVGLDQSSGAVLESSSDNVVRGNNAGAAQFNGTITPITGL